jgi:uncharacterized protein
MTTNDRTQAQKEARLGALRRIFGDDKPVIAMVHIPALPGTPRYDASGGMDALVESARKDISALQEAGVDAIMFGNENDRPYQLDVDVASTAGMAYVIGRLQGEIRVPFGVDVLWDPLSTVGLAAATGARFAREIFTGVYGSDMGLWQRSAATALRYRRQVARDDLFLLFNVTAEFASPLDARNVAQRAKSVVFSSLADAILVSGPMTGQAAPLEHLESVRQEVRDVPVLANTGVKHENVADILKLTDGCVVGTSLKVDGNTWNPVDRERAVEFMRIARKVRQN